MSEVLQSIGSYFLQDPLRVLYVLGGSGGVVFWWKLYRDRPRLKIRLLDQTIKSVDMSTLEITTRFEIENISDAKTSLEPEIVFTGYTPKRERSKNAQNVLEGDRSLPPFTPKIFTLNVKHSDKYPFLLFRTYQFRFTRGGKKRIRIRSESKARLGYVRHFLELSLFRLFGLYLERPARSN